MAGSCEHGNEPLGLIKSQVTVSFSRRTLLHGVSSYSLSSLCLYRLDNFGMCQPHILLFIISFVFLLLFTLKVYTFVHLWPPFFIHFNFSK